ncbi:MAG TPA: hypothetical protein VEF55_04335 [Candidatus Binatia bacterium]|nr:hypothetical protein [Candidatus Binatia bacterium]
MKRLFFCIALLGACAQEPAEVDAGPPAELAPVSLPVADQAGNRMEALTPNGARWCTADNAWCVEADENGARAINGAATIPLGGPLDAWPNIIRNADGSVIVGLIRTQSQMYSGGGGEGSELRLYTIAGDEAADAGALPYHGSLMIRACFGEEDQRTRREACHDQYDFETRISLNEAASSGPAQILLETAATTYPGQLARNEDSTERPPLRASDLVTWVDPACSYRRTYIRGADGRYGPDEPLPDCSQYLEP